ncbi:MAG: H-NS family nucleoid-associated regulatory protein [Glaciecola sp.]|nr:H-NS family nucleoid-associated regulatory protein [Glaciecola sp.]
MSEFSDILLHARRLQGATKDLSLDELFYAQEKLALVIEKRKEKQAQYEADNQAKIAQIEAIKKQMLEAGLDISDFDSSLVADKPKRTRKRGAKRPVKYAITVNSDTTSWTGIGRMPVVFTQALANGKSLEDFAV